MRRRRMHRDSARRIQWRHPDTVPAPVTRTRRVTRRVVSVGLLGVTITIAAIAFALWLSAGTGGSSVRAQTVNGGNQPNVTAAGSSVTVSWSPSTLSGGTPVSGYLVHRYNADDVPQTIGPSCNGTITGLSCTENDVPNGTWRYSVTPVRGNWTGAESAKTSVVVAAPTVTSASPSSRGQGASDQNITVTGSNFVSGATVAFSGTGITVKSTTFNSSTQLTANITIATAATTGARDVTVVNPDAGTGSCTTCFTVNAGPTVTSTSPSSRAQGATNQNVGVVGSNFVRGTTVSFSGTGITVNSTTFFNSSLVTVNITIASNAPTGARDVTVTNPDSGSGSCTSCFTVNAAPTVTSLSPASLPRFTTQTVTVVGTNFVSGATVAFTGPRTITVNGSPTFVDSSHLSVNITTPNGPTAVGFYTVTVTNPDGGVGSCANCFQVT